MTAAVAEAPPASEPPAPPPERTSRPRTVATAALVLLAIYGVLSAFNDPRGTLGTDTGGKLASLRAMERNGGLDPDLGYWAEQWDPDGDLHPLFYTKHVDDRWVNLTTLPMPYLAVPLRDLGGDRVILLLPMLGAVLAALAARALARRLGSERAGWWAFWLVGLASPVAVYALDFWEHSLGLAALLWAGVMAFDLATGRAGPWAAAGAGALIGLGATMRTEALVYGLVFGVAVALALARRGAGIRGIAARAAAAAGALVAVLLANQLLERATLGASLRAGRAANTATAGATGVGRRAEEAVTTLVGLNRFEIPADWLLGALVVLCMMYGIWRLVGSASADRAIGVAAILASFGVYLVRFGAGAGFVPGLLTASPLAAAGVVLASGHAGLRRIVGVALGALPIVWVFQYSGGAAPQWGARYLLVSGALLAVVAAVRLVDTSVVTRTLVVVLAAFVTTAGIGWLHQRSHAVADGMERLVRRGDAVVVSREAHLLREGGAFYTPERRWLTAVDDAELRRAARIAAAAGSDELTVIQFGLAGRPERLGEFERGASEPLEFLPGGDLTATVYRAG